ncbi:heavy-metal-associated domain-containing protein [Stutzerimonas sp. VN223-3]|uniref:heavy-metal-associated domain-containing protein n=1 Tax=Stutzerimonas sp. VN223-3 TaxID=3384601 RepID=UPI0038B68BBF
MTTIDLQVQGMTCGSCVRHVTQALTPIAGVDRVEVDLDTGLVRVEGNADSTALITALDDAGYPAQAASNTTPTTAAKTGCGSGCGCR